MRPSFNTCRAVRLALEMILEQVSHIFAWSKWNAWTIPPHSSLFNFSPPLNSLLQTKHLKHDWWNLYEPASLKGELPRCWEQRWHLATFDHSLIYLRSDGMKRLIRKRYSLPLILIPTSSPSTSKSSPFWVFPSTVVQTLPYPRKTITVNKRQKKYRHQSTIANDS